MMSAHNYVLVKKTTTKKKKKKKKKKQKIINIFVYKVGLSRAMSKNQPIYAKWTLLP